MPPQDFRSFLARAVALVDSSPPTTRGETRDWLVDPFLETLGWDVRADSCLTDLTVDGTRIEYVPRVGSVPALFVAVEGYEESLTESRANALRGAMAWTGVDRAIYTNGRQYLLLAGTTDVEYRVLGLSDLVDADETLADYARESIERRLEHHSRAHVARQLAVERPRLVDSLVDLLTDATVQGDAYAGEFESAADRFLDRLVVAFAGDGPAATDETSDVSIRFDESSIGDGSVNSTDGEYTGSDAAGEDGTATPGSIEAETAPPTADRDDESVRSAVDADGSDDGGPEQEKGNGTDGEYVVRFFSDRGSIGAIGHSTPEGALVETAEYLFERGLSGIEVPWSPADADETVLNAEPVHADGSPMATSSRLSNGLYLATGGDVDDHAARVEALADRAGLRAMLTGDWDSN